MAATSKPNRLLSGFHERFRQFDCPSSTMRENRLVRWLHAKAIKPITKARPAHAEQIAEAPPKCLSTLEEKLVDRIAQHGSLIRQSGRTIEIDHKRERRVPRHILGPADNELLSLRIEISVTKWRRVDGVEQLL